MYVLPPDYVATHTHQFHYDDGHTYAVIIGSDITNESLHNNDIEMMSIVVDNGDTMQLLRQDVLAPEPYIDSLIFIGNMLIEHHEVQYSAGNGFTITSIYRFSRTKKRYILESRYRMGRIEYERRHEWIMKVVDEPYEKTRWGKETLP